jgi:hypothetical protein
VTVTLAIASFTVALAAAVLVVDPQPQSLLGTEQAQVLETTLYVIAFAVILPLVLIVVPRLADAIALGPNARGLPVLAAFLAATLAGSVFLAEAALGGGTKAVLAIVGMWSIGAAALLARAARPISWCALLRCAGLVRATAGFSPRGLATDASALRLITERFDLRVIHRDDQGFVVAALEPRRAPAT